MAFCRLLMLSAVLLAHLVLADTLPMIPDTPAGRALVAWLDAFNSGDRARVQAFIDKYQSKRSIDEEMMMRKFSGGFDLLAIEKSERTRIVFRLKEKDSTTQAVAKLDVSDMEPLSINLFSIYQAPPGATYADFVLDAAECARVIAVAQKFLAEIYVFPNVAKKMVEALNTHQKHGDYNAIIDGEIFSQRLTDDLRQIGHDKHLSVDFHMFPIPAEHARDKSDDDRYRIDMERQNCGFERVEHLPGNIGYLKFDMFAAPNVCGETAIAAMGFLAHSDAIIFDLRENGGGAPRMIALIQTYLFDIPTHLNDIHLRKEDATEQSWTLSYIPGKRLANTPVYVLTSKNTFSGAEEFAYNLKNLKRATLIGETTGGGAHPVGANRIDDHFSIQVPFARSISPITKTNWEGVGVEPDVKVPAEDALDTAIKLATKELNEAKQ